MGILRATESKNEAEGGVWEVAITYGPYGSSVCRIDGQEQNFFSQLNPSKCPLRILSPIGEGARRGLAPSPTVAERFGLRPARMGLGSRCRGFSVGLAALFGGGCGGDASLGGWCMKGGKQTVGAGSGKTYPKQGAYGNSPQ
jgi:hypothetical protein